MSKMLTKVSPDGVITGVYLIVDEGGTRRIISLVRLRADANKLPRNRPRLLFVERGPDGRIVTFAASLHVKEPLTKRQLEQIKKVILRSAEGTGKERFVAVV